MQHKSRNISGLHDLDCTQRNPILKPRHPQRHFNWLVYATSRALGHTNLKPASQHLADGLNVYLPTCICCTDTGKSTDNPSLARHATVVADMDVCNKHHQGDGLQPYALNLHSGPAEASTSGQSVPFWVIQSQQDLRIRGWPDHSACFLCLLLSEPWEGPLRLIHSICLHK